MSFGIGCSWMVISAGVLAGLAGSAQAAWVEGAAEGETRRGVVNGGWVSDSGLPFFDIRTDAEGLPTAAVTEAILKAEGRAAKRALALRLLESRVAGGEVTADEDQFFGTPGFVRSTRSFLTGPAKEGPRDAVRAFVGDYRGLMEVSGDEVARARVAREYVTAHNGVTHLTFQQQIAGVDLFGCQLKANVAANGALVNISSTMLNRPEGDFATPAVVISDLEAIYAAAANVGVTLTDIPAATGEGEGASLKRTWVGGAEVAGDFGLRPDETVVTELVYFPLTRDEIRPAWMVVTPVKGIGHTYDIVVDATDGTVLWRHNRLVSDTTQAMSFRVYSAADNPQPLSPSRATPDGFQAPFVAREFVVVQPSDVSAFSPNGWINDGNRETVGNNVDAHLDVNADNVADTPRPNGGAGRVFDFPLDTTQAPSTYQDAAVTQLFYRANVFHDRLYAMGFDEAAGNFQTSNFGRGGVGGDAVQADAQDGAGTNNANFSTTGTDGSSARVQMFVFTGASPDRDGSLDGDIVYHELAHGLSIRLHGGLSGSQPGGQGEGWSDFFGICLLAQASDDPDANYATGPYATFLLGGTLTNNFYFGIRRFPYSTSFSVNPLTFADIDPAQQAFPAGVPRSTAIGNTANEVHNQGEVWCNALLEGRAALWRQMGFAGNQLMMQLVVDGMKLAPNNPTFLQSRDAILQADLVNNGGANSVALWSAFARRGMGAGATSPGSNTTSGVGEAFDVPQRVDFSYPDGLPASVRPGEATTLRVSTQATNLSILAGSGSLVYSVGGGAAASVALEELGAGQYRATIPAQLCGPDVRYYLSLNTTAGLRTDPSGAPGSSYAAPIVSSQIVPLADDFESDRGWTVGPTTASSGAWVRVDPNGTAAAPGDDNTVGGTQCFVTGQGTPGGSLGEADVDNGLTTLVSPLINGAGLTDVTVSYARWYSNGTGQAPFADTFRVDVSVNNGASWTNAETVGPGSAGDANTNGGWVAASWTLSSLGLAPTGQMRLRFVAEDGGTGSLVEAAVDDVRVGTTTCTNPTASCPVDFNGDGATDPDDLSDYIACFFATPACAAGDFNSDGVVDPDDLSDYIAAFFNGGC